MKRRDFLTSTVAAAGIGALLPGASAEDKPAEPQREFYELRTYHLRRGPKTSMFDSFYRDAAIPALNRAGVSKVGVFSVAVGPDSPSMHVLIAHSSLDSLITTPARMAADAEYLKAGAAFLDAPATNPMHTGVESSLLMSFTGMPKLEVPAMKSRLFELRTYQSHSKKACHKKIEMFNNSEIAIFRRTGLQPVFFGETLIGSQLPNLTYMLVYENQEAHDRGWAKFSADPEWNKLRATPGYTDAEIVCNITNVMLRPTAYSQI